MAMLVGAKDHAGWGDHLCMDALRLQTPKSRTGPIQQDRYHGCNMGMYIIISNCTQTSEL